eukprot:m.68553 g.68553  ORF g.68553 m.68553 type:complete len:765 (+) comp35534_c0_seq2:451-2745(+)
MTQKTLMSCWSGPSQSQASSSAFRSEREARAESSDSSEESEGEREGRAERPSSSTSSRDSSSHSSSDCESGTFGFPPPAKRFHTGKAPAYVKGRCTAMHRKTYPWLVVDASGKEAFCKFCKEYFSKARGLPRGSDGTFVNKPFTKWSKAYCREAKNNKLLKHQESKAHREAVVESELSSEVERRGSVVTQLHTASEHEKVENLKMLFKYVKVAYWLMKNEVAHTTKYESLIDLCSEFDSSGYVARWQSKRGENATYKSAATSSQMVKAIGSYLDEKLVASLSSSPMLSLMADEATDMRNRTELSVCLRYLNSAGCSIESFLHLTDVPNTTAKTITESIIRMLECRQIEMSKIIWLSFDGASNMSGSKGGVQALLSKGKCPDATYIHCRSHRLQLACVYAAEKIKPIKQLFSALNSLWRFFSQSPKKTHALREIQDVLEDSSLSLVQPGSTRWTSHYRAVKAVVSSINSIVTTLQHIHQESGDLSSEAGGLLLTFQSRQMIVLLHAVLDILNPVYALSLSLQKQSSGLSDIPDLFDTVQNRFEEIVEERDYVSQATESLTKCSFPLIIEEKNMTDHDLHVKIVQPYVKILSESMKSRFSDAISKMCSSISIFNPDCFSTANKHYGESQIRNLAEINKQLVPRNLLDEWKTFRNYLKVQAKKPIQQTSKDILSKLAATNSDLSASFPQLSVAAKTILVCPLGTASVERSFSTMARICNRLRQQIKPENLSHCLRASIEGPDKLTDEQAMEITKRWHSMNKHRRIKL